MNVRRTLLIRTPTLLYALCVAFVAMWILEIKAHNAFTDRACPFLAAALFFAVPIGCIVMWWAGRTEHVDRREKRVAWLSLTPLLIPWGFVSLVFLCLAGWKGD